MKTVHLNVELLRRELGYTSQRKSYGGSTNVRCHVRKEGKTWQVHLYIPVGLTGVAKSPTKYLGSFPSEAIAREFAKKAEEKVNKNLGRYIKVSRS